jgi:hypothetical protein
MSEVMARAVTDDLRDGFDLRGTGIKDASTALVPLLERLKSCDQMAAKEDALRFGRIDYRARYVGGTFKEFIDRRDDNAFTDSLRNCIAESIIGFRPVEKSAVEIQVVY